MSAIWPAERVERARVLWFQGLSGSQIAAKLNAPSRHSIIGLAWRQGWKRSEETSRLNRVDSANRQTGRRRALPTYDGRPIVKSAIAIKPKNRAEISNPFGPGGSGPALRRLAEVRAFLPPPEPEPDGPVAPLLALESHHCRWPIGVPSDPSFGFCGKRRAEGATYCPSCIRERKPYLPTPKVNTFNPDGRGVRRAS